MHPRLFRALLPALAASLFALCLTGCTGSRSTSRGPVFFPPAPNLPRLQYLTGISSTEDLVGVRDEFSLFSTGKVQPEKVTAIVKPSGIASHAGKIYVTDLSGQLYVIDPPNKTLESFKGNQGMGKLKKPVGIAVDEAGFVFVADIGRKEVLVYDAKGEYLKSVKAKDLDPTDVAVDDSRVYILDTRKAVIRVFDPTTGQELQQIGRDETDPEKTLNFPTKMSLDARGILRVSNAGSGNIMSFDRDGHFLGAFGKSGDGLGQFARPKGLASDQNGYLYVVDAGFQNVQIFNDQGRLLTYFGSPKLAVGAMNLPCDIAVSRDGLAYYQAYADKDFELSQVVFVVNQFGTPKISIYGYGKRRGIDYDQVYEQSAKDREKKAQEELQRRKQLTQEVRQEQPAAPPMP